MEVKTKKHFNEIIKSLTEEILDEEELEEMSVTGNIDGYMTPFAFSGKKGKKKKKRISTNSTGYDIVKEQLDDKDLRKVKLLIRNEVAEIIKNIWLKRSSWKN